MEQWQKDYIKCNIIKLLDYTICNEVLLAMLTTYNNQGMLSDFELAEIRGRHNRYDKTQYLYEVMKMKENGYAAITSALAGCNQTGAYDLLRLGYAHYLSPSIRVTFLGKTKPLSKYFNKREIEHIIEETKAHISAKQYISLYDNPNIGGETIKLVGDIAPPSASLYIDRKLYKRVIVNPKLYHANCHDIFVFSGIRLFRQLTDLVHPHIASLSSVQLTQDKLTSRFIQLDEDGDWADILEITHAPTHLIKYDETTKVCVLERTTGGSKVISQHLERPEGTLEDETTDKIISEDTFINTILNESGAGVCICDSPGMGKTLLLAKIAHKIAERSPDRFVAFIPLSNFIHHLAKHGIPEDLSEVDAAYARNAILDYVSTSALSLCILDRLLEKGQVPMELMLDGFDEVNFKYVDFTKKLLKEIATNFLKTRVYVTSRTHMKHELEGSLGVIAFDIAPFTQSNQQDFLVKFWKKDKVERDAEKLSEFARNCLQNLVADLSEEEKHITGIPLMCRLLAQVYSRQAKRFGKGTRKDKVAAEDDFQFKTSLPNLYTKYIERSFEKLEKKNESVEDAEKYHIGMAFKALFPEFELFYCQEFSVSGIKSVVDSSVSVGILERRYTGKEETVEFAHRTFAEYFVSEFFAKMVKNMHHSGSYSEEFKEKVAATFLQSVLLTRDTVNTEDHQTQIFIHSVVTYFFNFFMEEFSFPIRASTLSSHLVPASVSPNRLYDIFLGCVRDNRANIFHLIKNILLCVNISDVQRYKIEIFPDGETKLVIRLINVSSVYSSTKLVESLFTSFLECFQLDLQLVCKELPQDDKTPLHFAIENADVEKIQYFANIIPLKGRNLLESCVVRSKEDRLQIVTRKENMVRFLVRKEKDLLLEAPYLLCDKVHLHVIKALIEEGADLNQAVEEETVVHHAARYMSDDDFHELCRFLIEDMKAYQLFKPDDEQWESPLPYILLLKKDQAINTIKMVLKIPGVDVNEMDNHGNSLFLIAVKEQLKEEMLDILLKAGAEVNMTNNRSENALHLAAQCGNVQLIKYLLACSVDCCTCDANGNTFLHVLAWKEITPDEYHELIDLLLSAGQTALYQIRNKRQQLPIHVAVFEIELLWRTLHRIHVKLVKENQMDINATDAKGRSILMYAAEGKRSVRCLRTLMQIGVDVQTQDQQGNTFAHCISACYTPRNYHKVLELLFEMGHESVFQIANGAGAIPFHAAVEKLDLPEKTLNLFIGRFFQTNLVDVNCVDSFGNSLLAYAAMGRRSITVLKSLMGMGVDVAIKDKNGNTFAHLMAKNYSAADYHVLVQLIIAQRKMDVFRVSNKLLQTPLHWAVGYLNLQKDTWNLINDQLVKQHNVDINSTDSKGYTPLMYAAMGKRNLNFLTTLLDIGADVRNKGIDGISFVHLISKYYSAEKYHEIAELLIDRGYGYEFDAADELGKTPLHWAVKESQLTTTTLRMISNKLLKKGLVDVNSLDSSGYSILIWAVIGNARIFNVSTDSPLTAIKWQTQQISFLTYESLKGGRSSMPQAKWSVQQLGKLIEMGVDIYIQDNDGCTFLHYMPLFYSGEQYHDIIELLVGRGQEKIFQIVNKNGQTPLHCAILELEPLQKTMEVLTSKLFETDILHIDLVDTNGNTFLMCAAIGGRSVQLLEFLLKIGADVMLRNSEGNTFAHIIPTIYSANEYHQIVETLVRKGYQKIFEIKNKKNQIPVEVDVRGMEPHEAAIELVSSFSQPSSGYATAEEDEAKMASTKKRRKIRKEVNETGHKIIFYETELLGVGSFGTSVYKGNYKRQKVAVKVVPFIDNIEDEFFEEFEKLTRAGNKNLIKLYGHNRGMNILLAIEQCDQNLKEYVKNNVYSNFDAKYLCRQIIDGMSFLHENDIVHGNLSPSNVLIKHKESQSIVKISDFGMSRWIPARWETVIKSSSNVGTTEWMPPEVLRRVQKLAILRSYDKPGVIKTSKSTDVFSVGCLLFFVISKGVHLFGKVLFREPNILNGHRYWRVRDINIELQPLLYLIYLMTNHAPKARSTLVGSSNFPVFWTSGEEKSFFKSLKIVMGTSPEQVSVCLAELERTLRRYRQLRLNEDSDKQRLASDDQIDLETINAIIMSKILEVENLETIAQSGQQNASHEHDEWWRHEFSFFQVLLWEAFYKARKNNLLNGHYHVTLNAKETILGVFGIIINSVISPECSSSESSESSNEENLESSGSETSIDSAANYKNVQSTAAMPEYEVEKPFSQVEPILTSSETLNAVVDYFATSPDKDYQKSEKQPEYAYQCDRCPGALFTSVGLEQHLKLHDEK